MMMDQDAEMIDDDEEEESVDPPMKLCGNQQEYERDSNEAKGPVEIKFQRDGRDEAKAKPEKSQEQNPVKDAKADLFKGPEDIQEKQA